MQHGRLERDSTRRRFVSTATGTLLDAGALINDKLGDRAFFRTRPGDSWHPVSGPSPISRITSATKLTFLRARRLSPLSQALLIVAHFASTRFFFKTRRLTSSGLRPNRDLLVDSSVCVSAWGVRM